MNCLHCHKPIEGKRSTKKYCSSTCKQYAYLNRNFSSSNKLELVSDSDIKSQCFENNEIAIKVEEQKNIQHVIKEEAEYQYITPDILDKIQHGYISLNIGKNYFSNNANNGGRITSNNFPAFSYFVPRLRCIIENLFQISYKSKVHYKTIKAISMALEEMLRSEQIKMLPNDFPFIDDFIKLFDQFLPLARALEGDKEGIKFTLNKAAIVRYVLILNLIRDCTKREPFNKLFPEVCKN
ncbi:MAG: hypothetical protein J0L69_14390 [Bacteroidetes bacterium]|nr:hypothetical protein [Bacteroidota bacterium]